MDRATAAYLDKVANEYNKTKCPELKKLWFKLVSQAVNRRPLSVSAKEFESFRKRTLGKAPFSQ